MSTADVTRTCTVCGARMEGWREGCPTCARAHAEALAARPATPAPGSGLSQRFVVLLVAAVALVGYVGCWRPMRTEAMERRCGSDASCYRAEGLSADEALERANAVLIRDLNRR